LSFLVYGAAHVLRECQRRLLSVHGTRPCACFNDCQVDVLFDEALRPSILEANLSPSMDTTASAHLGPMKERVLRDTLRLAVTRANVPAALPELPPGGEACTFEQARWYWIESETRRELANLGGYLPLMPNADFWPHVQPLLVDPSGYAARLHTVLFT